MDSSGEPSIWQPEHRTRSNWGRVRERTSPFVSMLSTHAVISVRELVVSINALYREVRAYLEQQGIQPLIEEVIKVFVRYEEAQNNQLALEVGIVVEEARSDNPRMLVASLPGGASAMLPQVCHRELADFEQVMRKIMGPADLRVIAEEGFEALEKWSVNKKKPFTGRPWMMFTANPQDAQSLPVPDTTVHFDVWRLLAS